MHDQHTNTTEGAAAFERLRAHTFPGYCPDPISTPATRAAVRCVCCDRVILGRYTEAEDGPVCEECDGGTSLALAGAQPVMPRLPAEVAA